MKKPLVFLMLALVTASGAIAQNIQSPPLQLVQPQGPGAPPVVVTLQDALDRAEKLDLEVQSAVRDVEIATEDRLQAKSALLPSVSHTTQFLGTQGNGVLPSGRFVSNDGVHLYRSWAVVHEDLSVDTLQKNGVQRAEAGQALAKARIEIAQRGLAVTVTKNYYALVTAQRKYATAQQGAQQAMRFLEISQQRENLGEAAHFDVLKAELQVEQKKQSFEDAQLAMEISRVNLAVLLFPALNESFTVVDDLESGQPLPGFPDVQEMAERENPEMRAALEALRQASLDVRGVRNAGLPSLALDFAYGIEANAMALRSTVAADPQAGVLPNLGYFVTANLTLPIFDWGGQKSKIRQAQTREKQAQAQVNQTQRQLALSLYAYYNEALAARSAIDVLRHTADLAAQSLDLTNIRYRAGESTAFEVVESQNLLVEARNAYADAQARYRVALATLQTITGSF